MSPGDVILVAWGGGVELAGVISVSRVDVGVTPLGRARTEVPAAVGGLVFARLRVGMKKWYQRSKIHPLFRMGDHGNAYREEVLQGTADPSLLPSGLLGSLQALQTKKVDGVALSADLYTGVVTTAAGSIIPITPTKLSGHWKYVAKGKEAGDSAVTADMLRLVPEYLLESHSEITNAALAGGCVPVSWKLEVMFPIEKIEGAVKIEKHRPIMLIEVCRKAYTGILIKMIRK